MIEVGGATPDRNFSYYFGIAGYNQGFRYVNNDNGANYDSWLGAPLAPLTTPNAGQYAEGGYCSRAVQLDELRADRLARRRREHSHRHSA